MSDKKRTEGKVLGGVAFWVSEFLVVCFCVAIVFKLFMAGILDTVLMGQILLFQGTIYSVAWTAKASSNFAKNMQPKNLPENEQGDK